MFSRLNLSEIKKNYKNQFLNRNGKISYCDKFTYFILPWIIGIILALIKIPNNDLKSLVGTIFSILIGMYLTLVVLLISNIVVDKKDVTPIQQNNRLDVIEQTIFIILYAVTCSIYTVVFLLFIDFISINNLKLELFFRTLIGESTDTILKTIVSAFIYVNAYKSIISFFIIIRSLIALFSFDLKVERNKLVQRENEDKIL
ncbi:hypothetical protein HX071_17240 [Myroides marinus]|uniref:hypothetical protein n=1 Tax=Myroides marinus TaxID=703342 RepID=UPI002577A7C4|nr:hypothetical protein [Myroides marinus]MDM1503926.1 hypothetical protein [Myroides marinus]